MIRKSKLFVLRTLRDLGVSGVLLNSPWRSKRLLILCYHGISLRDEHEWRPGLYVTAQHFQSRMEMLRKRRCAVLPLGEALERLRRGTLPPRAVTITFDDGFYDFYKLAWPVLRAFSFPATVYLTTYYSQHSEWPVFDLMLSYVLWKSSARQLEWPEVLSGAIPRDEAGQNRVQEKAEAYCRKLRLSGAERHAMLASVCRRLDFDLQDAIEHRMLCLMNAQEVQRVAAEGADIQLHTHRHRVFARRERFWQEVDENRERIGQLTGQYATHFCHPGNFRLAEVPAWLKARGVESATTCDLGLAKSTSDPYLLPRVLDISTMEAEEFDAWVCGVAGFLPRRIYAGSSTQLGEEAELEAGA